MQATATVARGGVQNHIGSRTADPRLYLLFLCDHVSGDSTPDSHATDRAEYLSLPQLVQRKAEVEGFCCWLAHRVVTHSNHLTPPCPETPYGPHVAFL